MRLYEDHVLGKMYADWSFERQRRAAAFARPRPGAAGLRISSGNFATGLGYGGVECRPASFALCLKLSRMKCCAAVGSPWRNMGQCRF